MAHFSGEGKGRLLPRMLVSVSTVEDGKKLEHLLDELDIPICYQCRGKGTAPSELMDIFGLGSPHRLVTLAILPRARVGQTLQAMARRLPYRQRGGGIAFSIPVTGMQRLLSPYIQEEAPDNARQAERMEPDMAKQERAYTVIWVSVSSGYSDDVVDAARSAGARGGTVIKGRRQNAEEVGERLGIAPQEEQEFVMIVVPTEKKAEVMTAINTGCGLRTEAHGVIFALPVDEVMGLEG